MKYVIRAGLVLCLLTLLFLQVMGWPTSNERDAHIVGSDPPLEGAEYQSPWRMGSEMRASYDAESLRNAPPEKGVYRAETRP